ncbi:MAG: DUF1385 domain-containing protein [Bdellovibrionia bacterium]
MKKASAQFTSIGGQAVIEGVMMRSPRFIAVAVRKPNQKIIIQSKAFESWSHRWPLLRQPVIRGVLTLFESMVQGMESLTYSAQVSADLPETQEKLSSGAIIASIGSALVLGLGVFVGLPHLLTVWVTQLKVIDVSVNHPGFHLVDGVFKMLILLAYVYSISWMKEIYRVFQYHGAEHKSIYAFEAGQRLEVESARKFETLHPRCGTSFLLFLVLISVLVFSFLFPLLRLNQLFTHSFLNHLFMVGVKVLLIFPVAGIAYEFIRACAFRMQSPGFRWLIWPGLMLQRLTTREPQDDQLEVALAALRQVLILEKQGASVLSPQPTEISRLSDLGEVQAQLDEFSEA